MRAKWRACCVNSHDPPVVLRIRFETVCLRLLATWQSREMQDMPREIRVLRDLDTMGYAVSLTLPGKEQYFRDAMVGLLRLLQMQPVYPLLLCLQTLAERLEVPLFWRMLGEHFVFGGSDERESVHPG